MSQSCAFLAAIWVLIAMSPTSSILVRCTAMLMTAFLLFASWVAA